MCNIDHWYTQFHCSHTMFCCATLLKKKECKKAKWLPEEVLQIVEDIREVKGKREKEKTYPTECRVPENSKER